MRKILIAMAIIGSTLIATGCNCKAKTTVAPCNECACQATSCGGDCNWIEIPGWECR